MRGKGSRSWILVAALVAPGCGSPDNGGSIGENQLLSDVQTEAVSAVLDRFDNRGAWIDHYATYPASCVTKTDALDGTRTLFHGCYDWHSSVHAHWAVLRADLTGEGGTAAHAEAEKIDKRLSAEAALKVKAELAATGDFEMPYGRAWLLRLCSEHELWATARGKTDPMRLRALGSAVATSMMTRYETTPPNPRSSDYQNDSWAVAQMVAWFRHVNDATSLEKVTTWVDDSFVAHPVTWAETNDLDPSAFFSRYWSWVYAVSETLPSEDAIQIIDPKKIPEAALTPIADPNQTNDVHHIGINWSRAWAIKSLAAQLIAVRGKGDEQAKRLVKSYQEHVQAGRKRHERYRGSYYAYDHWVPQFAIYGITD